MRLFVVLTVAIVAFGIASPAIAKSCKMEAEPTAKLAGDRYLVLEACGGACVPVMALYEESNGIAGLQRKDRGADNTCSEVIAPDERIL